MMKQMRLIVCFLLLGWLGVTTAAAQSREKIIAIKIDSLVSYYKNAKGVMIINFWSTWCKPCIEEIPHFIAVTEKYKKDNVTLTLVSQDTKSLYESGKLKNWLQKKHWQKASIVWLNETEADYFCTKVDASWSGAIPATVIINPSKNYYRFFEESLSAEALEMEIKKAING